LSSTIVVSGLGIKTPEHCKAAITTCLIFYTTSKMTLYLFLLERSHIVRAPFMQNRIHDWLWV
ncbi:hypothetical protein K458DRAFT_268884, partial [Lentithecium fluviatile CBS 122367]